LADQNLNVTLLHIIRQILNDDGVIAGTVDEAITLLVSHSDSFNGILREYQI
jgi:hypothetical protein